MVALLGGEECPIQQLIEFIMTWANITEQSISNGRHLYTSGWKTYMIGSPNTDLRYLGSILLGVFSSPHIRGRRSKLISSECLPFFPFSLRHIVGTWFISLRDKLNEGVKSRGKVRLGRNSHIKIPKTDD